MNTKQFTYICKLSQNNLKKYVYHELKKTHSDIVTEDGFVFAKGTFPVLLVAHLDTVHEHLPKKIYFDKNKNTISSPDGIGGDDRCGVYLILELIKKYNCSVVFCEDEEIGGKGADKFASYFLDNRWEEIQDINYIVELDRKGNNDAVFYDCANDEFEDFITQGYFKTSWGTFSDISYIAPALTIAAVNLSCGYYNAHTKSEYVVVSDVEAIYNNVCKLFDRTDASVQYEYVERTYSKSYDRFNYGAYGDYSGYYNDDDDEGDGYYCIEYMEEGRVKFDCIIADNVEYCLGRFMIDHSNICYNDILSITKE